MGMLSKAAAIGALWVSTPAHGEVELSGSFTATQASRAFQSILKQSNPGNVTIGPGRAGVGGRVVNRS
jgi:ribonuclease T2